MAIAFNIMRPEPITRQEFLALVENDPELSFLSSNPNAATGGDFTLYQSVDGNIDVALGSGPYQHPSAGFSAVDLGFARTEQNLLRLIAIAGRLNARVWQDTGCSFCRLANGHCERYKDDEYYFAAVKNDSQVNWMTLEQIALQTRQERFGRVAAVLVFCMILGAAIYFYGIPGALISAAPAFFLAGVSGTVFTRDTRLMLGTITWFSLLLLLAIGILCGFYFLFNRNT